ncbi:hypothetical protein HBHAL_2883 [Halobacillus halophilus DSM 2266]|uniref:Uncharacterized protein n=1 Tax=Halobacillus halophilus (strain ATCC 35676 / DSM 2266 / JCM 20832 / KCTC 3685 / LMG 17431 / NBRC 102448 / NCIMB 2269) TaxID=866895 RepID=I0JM61_HALH3|nr:hypothetical protein HBHAL_2883 [Halobacillus halophilus DSM 2266]
MDPANRKNGKPEIVLNASIVAFISLDRLGI